MAGDSAPRQNYVTRVEETTLANDGRWHGSGYSSSQPGRDNALGGESYGKPTEKMLVPEFDGEGTEVELGKTARSYLRKIKAWAKCTRLPERERALALYTHLGGKAWVCAEELDVDLLGSPNGMDYYVDWVRVRFMEMKVNKVSSVMSELFRKCRRGHEQTVRDFNVVFERLLLHLTELNCELPQLVKAWLYLDRLRLSEGDELAILASVGNKYDLKLLQQAAIVHDRSSRKTSWEPRGRGTGGAMAREAVGPSDREQWGR